MKEVLQICEVFTMGMVKTNFNGRLRSVKFSKKNALLPIFEAVVNSIQAIEDRPIQITRGTIKIQLERVEQGSLDENNKIKENVINNVTITDNGVGFTNTNMNSFNMLDSDYKINRGGKGIGRLIWLKAFHSVEVESVYIEENEKRRRVFTFDEVNDVTPNDPIPADANAKINTVIRMKNYRSEYAPNSTAEHIGLKLLEHCAWFMIGNQQAPEITILDSGHVVNLSDLLENSATTVQEEPITIGSEKFDISHVLFRFKSEQKAKMVLMADQRVVEEFELEKRIPGLIGRIKTPNGNFDYLCRVSSDYLNKQVSQERSCFEIPEKSCELEGYILSKIEIVDSVLRCISCYLSEYLKENKAKSRAHLEKYIAEVAPRYRPFLKRIQGDLPFSDGATQSEMDKFMHQHQYDVECRIIEEGHKIIEAADEHVDKYETHLNDYLRDIDDIKKSDLAGYVGHRRAVIELLKMLVKRRDNDKFEIEARLHSLILPMKIDSMDEKYRMANLWLLDERLAFHDYLTSDLPFKCIKITDSESKDRPDGLILQVYDGPVAASDDYIRPKTALSIIEFKKPMRDDMTSDSTDPLIQSLDYLDKIRSGKAETSDGRLINIKDQDCYIYVIADLTLSLRKRCKQAGLKEASDGLSFYGPNENYGAHIEVISYDALISRSYERNYAFFEKLGLPSKL